MFKSASQEKFIEIDNDLFDSTISSSNTDQDLKALIRQSDYFSPRKEPYLFTIIFELIQDLFEIDLSSVNPNFEPLTSSSLLKKFLKEDDLSFDLEFDDYLRMPPIREYELKVKISKIEKAKPKIDFSEYDMLNNEEYDDL